MNITLVTPKPGEKIFVLAASRAHYDDFVYKVCKELRRNVKEQFKCISGYEDLDGRPNGTKVVWLEGWDHKHELRAEMLLDKILRLGDRINIIKINENRNGYHTTETR